VDGGRPNRCCPLVNSSRCRCCKWPPLTSTSPSTMSTSPLDDRATVPVCMRATWVPCERRHSDADLRHPRGTRPVTTKLTTVTPVTRPDSCLSAEGGSSCPSRCLSRGGSESGACPCSDLAARG
jgi:hypothetical protein